MPLGKISLIAAVCGSERLRKAAECLIRQTYADWELIITCYGENGMIDIPQDSRGRIRILNNVQKNRAEAIIRGMKASEGEWIAFLEEEVLYEPDGLEKLIGYSGDSDFVMGKWLEMPECTLEGFPGKDFVCVGPKDNGFVNLLRTGYRNRFGGKIYRKRVFQCDTGSIPADWAAESFFISRLDKINNITAVPVAVCRMVRKGTKDNVRPFRIGNLSLYQESFEKACLLFSESVEIQGVYAQYAKAVVQHFYNIVHTDALSEAEKHFFMEMQMNQINRGNACSITAEHLAPVTGFFWQKIRKNDVHSLYQALNIYEYLAEQINISSGMKRAFKIRMAGLTVEIRHKENDILEKCSPYLAEEGEEADLMMAAPDEKILFSKAWFKKSDGIELSDGEAEFDAAPHSVYGILPAFGAFWLHAAVIEINGEGFAFSADSGVGKSTHAQLWLKAFPDARIINGDNPIIRTEQGIAYAYGTPFCGKEGYQVPARVPLKGICFLQRAETNRIERVDPSYVATRLFSDNPYMRPETREQHLMLHRDFSEIVPGYILYCNMDVEAAVTAYHGMKRE